MNEWVGVTISVRYPHAWLPVENRGRVDGVDEVEGAWGRVGWGKVGGDGDDIHGTSRRKLNPATLLSPPRPHAETRGRGLGRVVALHFTLLCVLICFLER